MKLTKSNGFMMIYVYICIYLYMWVSCMFAIFNHANTKGRFNRSIEEMDFD